MIECPSCGRRQQPQLLCGECGSPLAADLDCFAALGIPKKLLVDLPSLERIYHDLSRKVHPDRFASKPVAVRDASLRATALLTRSYRTLRDPVSRGLYWLELNGAKLAEDNNRVPPELAEMVFDVQEQLAELRAAAGDAKTAGGLAAQVAGRRIDLQAAMDTAIAALDANFTKWDEGKPDGPAMLISELKAILSRIAYLRTLLRDVDRGLEHAKAA
jgi:molecular chaperone HscB